jgi:hypothetical protein
MQNSLNEIYMNTFHSYWSIIFLGGVLERARPDGVAAASL